MYQSITGLTINGKHCLSITQSGIGFTLTQEHRAVMIILGLCLLAFVTFLVVDLIRTYFYKCHLEDRIDIMEDQIKQLEKQLAKEG